MRKPAAYELLRLIIAPFERFMSSSIASGVLLSIVTLFALAWVNWLDPESYHHLWEIPFGIQIGSHQLTHSLHFWINDGLMAVFFLLVGLEIKRELLVGELASPRKAALPVIAALGGMVVPAGIFVYFNQGLPTLGGWGIPMATDIAFALGVVALLGRRVPIGLKVFLTALAIVDDLGAVLVIAFFYTAQLNWLMLVFALVTWLVLWQAGRAGVNNLLFYCVGGVILWLFTLQSGIHATLAGVALALAIPAKPCASPGIFLNDARRLLDDLADRRPDQLSLLNDARAIDVIKGLEAGCELIQPPLLRMEHHLHHVVAFLIMPLFALANAGVIFNASLSDLFHQPASMGIIAGLVLGKPLGIVLFTLIARLAKWVELPEGASWSQVIGVGFLAGIGFTMSIFIAGLAYPDEATLALAKSGILLASVIAIVLGVIWLLLSKPQKPPKHT
ncbi:Na+/H+ antiporter NhaA [Leeia sp. TBRC 13508]|uniref:Na(+)/H(+) antiporter NhaA n=1 Tax=Leeia speluncae TaxID=2884804 RepID=A0ABS8D3K4_9NEIS|nr:Na+/H+ antiporter NhaA [Leeia speluncae]MCB6182608.1 Na+/H+ antiporter NhaA [Leeia speluncae]